MRIDANFSGDLVGFRPHIHEETGTKTVTLAVRFKVDEAKAKSILGKDFHRLAFGSMQVEEKPDGERYYELGYEEIKPKIVCEAHQLHVHSHGPLAVMPSVKSIRPSGKGEAAVLVTLELPILIEKPKLAGDLAMAFGDVVDVALKASQGELALGDKPAGVVMKNTGAYGNPEPVRV